MEYRNHCAHMVLIKNYLALTLFSLRFSLRHINSIGYWIVLSLFWGSFTPNISLFGRCLGLQNLFKRLCFVVILFQNCRCTIEFAAFSINHFGFLAIFILICCVYLTFWATWHATLPKFRQFVTSFWVLVAVNCLNKQTYLLFCYRHLAAEWTNRPSIYLSNFAFQYPNSFWYRSELPVWDP